MGVVCGCVCVGGGGREGEREGKECVCERESLIMERDKNIPV